MITITHYGVKGMKWGVRKDRNSAYMKRFNKRMKRLDDEYIKLTKNPFSKRSKRNLNRIIIKGEKLVDDLLKHDIMDRLSKDEKKRVEALVDRYVYGPDFEKDPYKKLY